MVLWSSWVSAFIVLVLLVTGLWNVGLALSEKGFYAISVILSLFSAITVQKKTRDTKSFSYEKK